MSHRVKTRVPAEMLVAMMAGKVVCELKDGVEVLLKQTPSFIEYDPERKMVSLFWDLPEELAKLVPFNTKCSMLDRCPEIMLVGVEPKTIDVSKLRRVTCIRGDAMLPADDGELVYFDEVEDATT